MINHSLEPLGFLLIQSPTSTALIRYDKMPKGRQPKILPPLERTILSEDPTQSILTMPKAKPVAVCISDDEFDVDEPNDGDDRASDGDYGATVAQQSPNKGKGKVRKQQPQSTSGTDQDPSSSANKKPSNGIGKKPAAANDDYRNTRKEKEMAHAETWKLIRKFEEEVASLRRRLDQAQQGRQKEKNMRSNVKGQIENNNIKTGVLQDKGQELRDELAQAKDTIKNLQDKLQRQESAITAWQEQTLDKLDSFDFPFDTDDLVTSEAKELFRKVRAWTYRYCPKDWQSVQQKDLTRLGRTLIDPSKPQIISARALEAILRGRTSPRVVILALINRELVCATLARPFSILAGEDVLHGKRGGSLTIEAVHNALVQRKCFSSTNIRFANPTGMPASAGKFRCLAMTAVKPSNIDGVANITACEELSKRVGTCANNIAEAVLADVTFLLDTQPGRLAGALSDLRGMVTEFICAAIALHAQYPYTHFQFGDRLMNENFTYPHLIRTTLYHAPESA